MCIMLRASKERFHFADRVVFLQVPENPHSEYGLTENVEVTKILLL